MSYETDDKMVSHPDHYKSGKYEVIDVIAEFTKGLTGIQAVDTANAIKYVLRWPKKNGVQDLKKAIWYLTHLVEHLEGVTQENPDRCVKPSIDDEPEPLRLEKSSSGVYIPEPRQEENADLIKKYDKLYKEYCHVRSIISPEDADNFVNLDAEFEETVMGELLNLKSVKRHLESISSVCNDPDLEYAYQIVRKDILNLEKFAAERWGNDKGEEESKCSE